MKKNRNKGKLVLFEGLDGAGKTAAAKTLITKLNRDDVVYSKGMGSDSFLGRLARRYGKTFFFLLEQFFITIFFLKPALRQGKIVLLDRYFFSVASHVPDTEKRSNKILLAFAALFLVEPDLIFYFKVKKEERLKRLKRTDNNPYHQMLINFPVLLDEREKELERILRSYQKKLIVIHTDSDSVGEIAAALAATLKERRLL